MNDILIQSLGIHDNAPLHSHCVKSGEVLGNRFHLEELLGEGSMGMVFKATDHVNNTPVAIKVLHPKWHNDLAARKTLQAEALKARALRHPGIIEVYDFDCDRQKNLDYITMRYLKGVTLKTWLANPPNLNASRRLRLDMVLQIALAIAYAHDQSCVHADIKPGNIFVEPNGKIIIFDFGLAHVQNTVLHAFTPAYSSLEVLNGKRPEYSDDLYSLGCLFYEILTGQHPYGRYSAQDVEKQAIPPSNQETMLNSRAAQWLRCAINLTRDKRPDSLLPFIQTLSNSSTLAWWQRLFN